MMDADGQYEVRLTYTDHGDYSLGGVWSPDGKAIVFSTGPDMPRLNIMYMNLDGTGRRAIGQGFVTVWSQDGKHLGAGDASIDVQTGSRTPFTDADGNVLNGTPSPDWNAIAFTRGETPDLWVYDKRTGDNTQITHEMRALAPQWSADGTSLTFMGYSEDGSSSEVYVARRDGSDLRPLTNRKGLVWSPSFSPDGSKIVFAADWDDKEWPFIYVMDRQGDHVTRLTGK